MIATSFEIRSSEARGLFRELNPGPPAPEAGIIPLDQTADANLVHRQTHMDICAVN